MSMGPKVDDLLDVVIAKDEVERLKYVGRYKVIKHDEQRDLYIIQLVEVRTEKEGDDGIPI